MTPCSRTWSFLPPRIKADGISYFDEKDDIKTPEKLIKAIETFLREMSINVDRAIRKAKRNRNMWVLIFTGGGLCYADFKGMDLAEYQEAVQARILYNEDWSKQRGE